jgi:hypothetical protein
VKSSDRRIHWCLLSGLVLACSGARSSQPGAPSPVSTSPVSQPAVPVAPTTGTASFKYAAGTVRYRISRSAAVENIGPDSLAHREISTNVSSSLLTLQPVDQTTNFTAVTDTSATTTQGLIGTVRSIQLPIQISGSFTNGVLTINPEAAGSTCNAASSMLVTDLHNLLIRFPEQLSTGVSWRDSAGVAGCQAGVPTAIHTIRSYVVSGDASYNGHPVLLILRTDTIRARGEGGLQQHRISIEATGTGTAIYYLETAIGQIVRLTVGQLLDLAITTSAKRFYFRQSSKQDFQIAR